MYLLSFQLLSITAALQTVGSALLPWDAGFPLFPIASHADLNAHKLGKKKKQRKENGDTQHWQGDRALDSAVFFLPLAFKPQILACKLSTHMFISTSLH